MYKKIISLLEQAKSPVCIVGGGATKHLKEVAGVIKKLFLPTLTTFNGIGCVASGNPLFYGRGGTIGQPFANYMLKSADVVLCIGTRNNVRQIGWNYKKTAKWIVVDIDKAELLKQTLKPDVSVCLDAGKFATELQKHIVGVNPYTFIHELTSMLPEDGVVVAANGMACVSLMYAGVVKSQTKFIMNSGTASMGYALPAAIGAYFATGRKITCIEGDGSILMNIQELATLGHYKLPIKIYVLDNDGYASIKQTQDNMGGQRFGSTKRDLTFPDYKKLGKVYGVDITVLKLSKQCIRKAVL